MEQQRSGMRLCGMGFLPATVWQREATASQGVKKLSRLWLNQKQLLSNHVVRTLCGWRIARRTRLANQ